jgi:hypothetical protein
MKLSYYEREIVASKLPVEIRHLPSEVLHDKSWQARCFSARKLEFVYGYGSTIEEACNNLFKA